MNRKIIISLSIIAVLALYMIISNLRHSSDAPDLPKWDGKADSIVITRSEGNISLLKKEGKWTVTDNAYPADAKAVEDIEKRFKDIRITDLISSKGYYSKYDLTPDKYAEIIIKKGDAVVRKFKIGKKSSTGRHSFVKVGDRPEIYLAEGVFDSVLNKKVDDLRDREMLKVKRDAVSSFSVDYQGRTFAFSKKKVEAEGGKAGKKEEKKPSVDTWVCAGYETVGLDTNKVGTLLQIFDPLRASSFPEVKKEELSQRMCTVLIKAFQKDITLTIYKKDAAYLAAISESPYVFAMEKYNAERFFLTGIEAFKTDAKR